MALSEEDINTIKLTIIETLNGRLGKVAADLKCMDEKAAKTDQRLNLLIGFLAGSGVIGVGIFGVSKVIGGG